MAEQKWIEAGRLQLGVAEIQGPQTSAVIASWLHRLSAWWSDDETPWCGVFVAHCIEAAGLQLPKNWMRAKAWAEWGSRLPAPVPGCVVVFERQGGGHVGFVVGRDQRGNLMVLGGNQGNRVSIAPFDRNRAIAYAWPTGIPLPAGQSLALMHTGGALSTNEA